MFFKMLYYRAQWSTNLSWAAPLPQLGLLAAASQLCLGWSDGPGY